MELNLKKIPLEFSEKDHRYTYNKTDWWPGVTSITGMLPKGWLATWAAKMAYECVKEKWKPNTKYSKGEIEEICYLAKTAHTRKMNLAADTGKDTHSWLEQFVKTGQEPPMPEDKEVANAIERFKEWENQHKIEWVASELIVGSERHCYGGKLDALAVIDDKFCLIDFKTSSGIFPEFYIQTGGYQLALEELGSPKIDERWILRFPKSGSSFDAHKVPSDIEEDKRIFLAAKEIYHWSKKNEN